VDNHYKSSLYQAFGLWVNQRMSWVLSRGRGEKSCV